MRCAPRIAALLLIAAASSACVTERANKPGLRVLPQGQSVRAPGPGNRSVATAAPPVLPPGPVAAPAAAASQNARIVVRVDPLATIPYDGQILPLVSPDARFIAVQQGEPPTWPTILAHDGAEPPTTTKLSVYDLSQAPPDTNTRQVEFPSPLPSGLMLGRACDNRGFLVESPREDGSRWIGRVTWVGGTLEWIIQGNTVNSHAVFTIRGDLLYTRRAIGGPRTELVLLTARGESVRTSEGSYLFPITTTEKDLVYAFNLSESGLQVEAIRLVDDPPGSGTVRLGRTFATAFIGKPGDAALAYQVTAPLQSAIVTGREHEDLAAYPLIFYHPDFARMVAFDTQSSFDNQPGSYTLLAPKSIAAIRWSEAAGYLCASPEGLMFTPEPVRSDIKRRPDIKLDSTPYVPRATADPKRPVILLGPSAKDPTKLWVRSLLVTDSMP
jgi:hypothetical protein